MASLNPLDLLGDDDSVDPAQLIVAAQKVVAPAAILIKVHLKLSLLAKGVLLSFLQSFSFLNMLVNFVRICLNVLLWLLPTYGCWITFRCPEEGGGDRGGGGGYGGRATRFQ